MKTLNPAVARVLKRLHYPLDVILTCVRWYVAYPLSLRHLEDMMAERGISVDHSTVHRWAIKLVPVLERAFRRRKQPVGKSWRMDETYTRVKGEWRYLYRAVDKDGNTIDFLLRAHRDKTAGRRYFEKSIAQNGVPETVTKAAPILPRSKQSMSIVTRQSGSASANISITWSSRIIGRSSDAPGPCWGSSLFAVPGSF
ncbi:integrase catalytic region [Caballeronia calidae]|uniref:Integrase catalytic region n=1 Tax=Caballeronia calidae TaxID=1777139 RepID=A0A158EJY3_9BURK|nr:integrase catalytic region [Caballeronia calidae]